MTARNIEERRTLLRTWLLQSGMSRSELAEKLGVTLASVNNWLSCTNIPEKRWEGIASLFNKHEEPERNRIVGTSLSEQEMALVEAAAEKMGMSKEDFFRFCLFEKMKSKSSDVIDV